MLFILVSSAFAWSFDAWEWTPGWAYSDARLERYLDLPDPWALPSEPTIVEDAVLPVVAPAVTLAVETEARRPNEAVHAMTTADRSRR